MGVDVLVIYCYTLVSLLRSAMFIDSSRSYSTNIIAKALTVGLVLYVAAISLLEFEITPGRVLLVLIGGPIWLSVIFGYVAKDKMIPLSYIGGYLIVAVVASISDGLTRVL